MFVNGLLIKQAKNTKYTSKERVIFFFCKAFTNNHLMIKLNIVVKSIFAIKRKRIADNEWRKEDNFEEACK